ncbi:hypothetical protein Holit_03411 [Hollandina sp. SP2]
MGMIRSVPDEDGIPILDDVGSIPNRGKPKPLGWQEPIVIDLRLRMMMRRIARPFPWYANDLPYHQIGFRAVGIVKNGPHDPGGCFPHGPFPPEFAAACFRRVTGYLEFPGVVRGRVVKLSDLVQRAYRYPLFCRNRKAPRGMVKKSGPGNVKMSFFTHVHEPVTLG